MYRISLLSSRLSPLWQKNLPYSIHNHIWVFSFVGQWVINQRRGNCSDSASGIRRKRHSFDFVDPGPVPQWVIMKKYKNTHPTARKILQDFHGFPNFRGEQERMIARLQDKGPTLYMTPTGGGKSLIYQVLARTIADEGIILVLAPLISLVRVSLYLPTLTTDYP